MREPKVFSAAALILLASLHLAVNGVWVSQDLTMRSMDMGWHLTGIAELASVIRHKPDHLLMAMSDGYAPSWPMAGYLPWSLGVLVTGRSTEAIRLFNVVWLLLLFGSVARIGARLGSRREGLLAAALVSLYPAVYGMSRQVGVDLPATAVGALCAALLLETRCFTSLGKSLLWGASLGCLILIRPLASVPLAPPALLVLILGIRRARPALFRPLLNAGAGVAIGGALSAPWWLGRIGEIWSFFFSHMSNTFAGDRITPPWFYLGELPRAASPLLLSGAAIALWVLLRQRALTDPPLHASSPGRATALLAMAVWFICGLAFISMVSHRFNRYAFPLLPPLALLTSAGLLAIPYRSPRRWIIVTLLSAGAASWLLCSFNWGRPVQCGPGELAEDTRWTPCGYWSFSGPPAMDPLIPKVRAITALIAASSPGGRDVIIQVPVTPDPNTIVNTKAQVMMDLPHVLFTSLKWADLARGIAAEGEYKITSRGWYALTRAWQPRRCFTLLFAPPGGTPGAPAPASEGGKPPTLLVREEVEGPGGPIRFDLWDHGPCKVGTVPY